MPKHFLITYCIAAMPLPYHVAYPNTFGKSSIRLAWQPIKAIETSLAVQNVFNLEHRKERSVSASQTIFGRSLYGQVDWTF